MQDRHKLMHYNGIKWVMAAFSISWWRHQMETFFALLAICAGKSPVPGELPAQWPVTRSFDVFFDLRPNKPWGWWFETPARSLWRHCSVQQRNSQNPVLLEFCEGNRAVTCGFPSQRCSNAESASTFTNASRLSCQSMFGCTHSSVILLIACPLIYSNLLHIRILISKKW